MKIILLVAITAIVRKVITLDIKHSEYQILIGIAILILSFCIRYYFLSRKENENIIKIINLKTSKNEK